MQAILVRVGVDHAFGNWNAPADPDSREFVYVPIPEKPGTKFHPRCERPYQEILPTLRRFAEDVDCDLHADLRCPQPLLGQSMHLDPDFEHLTYGDVGDRRGAQIAQLDEDDLLVFYAGLQPCRPCDHRLIYAIVGIFVIDEVVDAPGIPRYRWPENAHTRKRKWGDSDIVVRAKPGVSGRLRRFIPIGEYRDNAYRVRRDLLHEWGGLEVRDGYIQRSGRPPRFRDAKKFYAWFQDQDVELMAVNNPPAARPLVVVVHLRQPEKAWPNETRADPFWEFGSFGCTGCHQDNLMHPDRIHELEGVRLAFAQGGPGEFRLVMLTPPVKVVRHTERCEVKWRRKKPFRFEAAPLLIDAAGNTDFPRLGQMIRSVDRSTWPARLSSKFRTRRQPLPAAVAVEVCSVFDCLRRRATNGAIIKGYEQALPYPPNRIDRQRKATYQRMLRESGADGAAPATRCKPRGCRATRGPSRSC